MSDESSVQIALDLSHTIEGVVEACVSLIDSTDGPSSDPEHLSCVAYSIYSLLFLQRRLSGDTTDTMEFNSLLTRVRSTLGRVKAWKAGLPVSPPTSDEGTSPASARLNRPAADRLVRRLVGTKRNRTEEASAADEEEAEGEGDNEAPSQVRRIAEDGPPRKRQRRV